MFSALYSWRVLPFAVLLCPDMPQWNISPGAPQPSHLAKCHLQPSEKEKWTTQDAHRKQKFPEPTQSPENYDSRLYHNAADEIRLGPSESILMATFCLNKHGLELQ